MVQYSLGGSGRYLNAEWHEIRRQAREETFSLAEWDRISRLRYDLDDVEVFRKRKDSSYIGSARVESEGGAGGGNDLRDDPAIRD